MAALPERVEGETTLKILLVDDQPVLLSAMRRMLSEHDCTTAQSASDALEILAANDFDGILCDLMMPGMDGAALHAVLIETRPDHAERMVFCTGGAASLRLQQFLDEEISRPVLNKPFDQLELDTVVARWKSMQAE